MAACQGEPRLHPSAVEGLLCDYNPAPEDDNGFTPVPAEELAAFELPPTEPYRLGIGDTIRVRAFGSEPVNGIFEEGVEVRVKDDGTIRLPKLKKVRRIKVEGLTSLELEDLLEEPLQVFVKDAIASVEVTGFGSRRFYVLGEVGNAGTFPVDSKTTLLDALIEAQGTNTETANRDEAYVIRNQQPVPFSIVDVIQRGHPVGRMVMQEHDIVFVPFVEERQDYVYIFGEVNSPTRLAMDKVGRRGTRGRLTLAAALGEVGGLNPARADVNNITIYRGSWQAPRQFRIGLQDAYRFGHDIQLRPGDRIAVATSSSAKFQDAIGPSLQLMGATTSGLSLAASTAALVK